MHVDTIALLLTIFVGSTNRRILQSRFPFLIDCNRNSINLAFSQQKTPGTMKIL